MSRMKAMMTRICSRPNFCLLLPKPKTKCNWLPYQSKGPTISSHGACLYFIGCTSPSQRAYLWGLTASDLRAENLRCRDRPGPRQPSQRGQGNWTKAAVWHFLHHSCHHQLTSPSLPLSISVPLNSSPWISWLGKFEVLGSCQEFPSN